MALSHAERGRLGAAERNARLTPEERRAIGRRAYLAGAVRTVADRSAELTPEQVATLRAVFGGAR